MPDKSVPTTVKVFPLSSLPALVIEGFFPAKSTNTDFVPISTFAAAAFEEISEIVSKIFALVIVPPADGPVITSLRALPFISVPVTVKDTEDKSLELENVRNEFSPDDAKPNCEPSITKSPELLKV